MSTTSKLAARLDTLKAKTTIYNPKTIEKDLAIADRSSLMKANTSARTQSSNEWIIDLFPNLIPITIECMLQAAHFDSVRDLANHPKVSIPTILMYFQTIIFSFFLLNDAEVRPTPSAPARDWKQSSYKKDFMSFLFQLPVPEFLVPFFTQLAATTPARMPNLFVVPTAAGVTLGTHFGKFIPLQAYALIHDLAASMAGNSNVETVYKKLFNSPLFTVAQNCQGTPFSDRFMCSIGDLLGITFAPTTNGGNDTWCYINSKLFQAFESTFNPVLFRDAQKRQSLAKISLVPIEFDHTNEQPLNPYDIFFSASPENLAELKVVLQSVVNVLDGHVKFNKSLAQCTGSLVGIASLDHAYSEFALPTHSTNPGLDYSTFAGDLSLIAPARRAIQLRFLQGHDNAPAAALTAHRSTVTDRADPPAVVNPTVLVPTVNMAYPFHVNRSTPSGAPFPANNQFIRFDVKRHYTPKVFILDVTADAEESAPLILLAGKIIESFELDGTIVAHPDTTINLGIQNHDFGSSLVPYALVTPATRFYPRTANAVLPFPLYRHEVYDGSRFLSASMLVNRQQMISPLFDYTLRDTAIPTGVPGHSEVSVNWVKKAQRFFSFKTKDRLNKADGADLPPATAARDLYLWSPYSYTPVEDQRRNNFNPALATHYYVSNFRSIFGTDTQMIEAVHPYEALPLV